MRFLVLFLVNAVVDAVEHPFDLPQFQLVLSQCRLQCPRTSSPLVKNGEFEGVTVVDHFYLEAPDTMVISVGSPENRCELRHNPEWATADTSLVPQTFKATVRLEPTNVNHINIMQIHSKNFLQYARGPPLMFKWRSSRSGKSDHLWANIRMDLVEATKSNSNFDLGPRPQGFFDVQVTVQDRILYIWINGDLKLTHRWGYLTLPQNYFKTGMYISSGDGPQKIEYKSLYIGPLDTAPTELPTESPRIASPTFAPSDMRTLTPTNTAFIVWIERLVLVNAETGQDVLALASDSVNVIDKSELPFFSIRADKGGSKGGSVWFNVDNNVIQKENRAPYTIAGDSSGNYNAWEAEPGQYKLEVTTYAEQNGGGQEGASLTVMVQILPATGSESTTQPSTLFPKSLSPSKTPSKPPARFPTVLPTIWSSILRVTQLVLVDTDTNQDLFALQPYPMNNVLELDRLPSVTIRADTAVEAMAAGSVVFWVGNDRVQTESFEPFALAGDKRGNYIEWPLNTNQDYLVTATPFSERDGNGTPGVSMTVLVSTVS